MTGFNRTVRRRTHRSRYAVAALVGTLLFMTGIGSAEEPPSSAGVVPDQARSGSVDANWHTVASRWTYGLDLLERMLADGRGSDARSLFRTIHRKHPTCTVAAFLYGRLMGGQRGLRMMRSATDANMPASESTRVRVLRSLVNAETHVEANARRAADTAVALAELAGESDAWVLAGQRLERASDLEHAEAAFRRAMRLDSTNDAAQRRLILVLAQSDRLGEAHALASRLVEKRPVSPGAHLHLGLIQCMQGKLDACRESYGAAMKHAGTDLETLAALGAAYIDIEEFALARQTLQRAHAINAKHVNTLIHMGVLEIRLADPKAAIRVLERASRIAKRNAHIEFLRGVAYEHAGRVKLSIRRYQLACRLDQTKARYPTALSLALVKDQQTTRAAHAMRDAIEIAPDDARLRMHLGFILMESRKWKRAEAAFLEAASKDAKDATPWFHIAVIRGDHRRDAKGALEALRAYVERGGQEPVALRWLETLTEREKK